MLAKAHAENIKRLSILRKIDAVDSGTEKAYDNIVRLTAELCDTPICLISLVEENRQ